MSFRSNGVQPKSGDTQGGGATHLSRTAQKGGKETATTGILAFSLKEEKKRVGPGREPLNAIGHAVPYKAESLAFSRIGG